MLRLGPEKPIVMVPGEAPYLLERINYLSDTPYAGRFDENPMHTNARRAMKRPLPPLIRELGPAGRRTAEAQRGGTRDRESELIGAELNCDPGAGRTQKRPGKPRPRCNPCG